MQTDDLERLRSYQEEEKKQNTLNKNRNVIQKRIQNSLTPISKIPQKLSRYSMNEPSPQNINCYICKSQNELLLVKTCFCNRVFHLNCLKRTIIMNYTQYLMENEAFRCETCLRYYNVQVSDKKYNLIETLKNKKLLSTFLILLFIITILLIAFIAQWNTLETSIKLLLIWLLPLFILIDYYALIYLFKLSLEIRWDVQMINETISKIQKREIDLIASFLDNNQNFFQSKDQFLN